jgi:hypothetical protein
MKEAKCPVVGIDAFILRADAREFGDWQYFKIAHHVDQTALQVFDFR